MKRLSLIISEGTTRAAATRRQRSPAGASAISLAILCLCAACGPKDNTTTKATPDTPMTEQNAKSTDESAVSTAEARLQAAIEKGVKMGAPSISAAVASPKGVLWTGVAGVRSIEPPEPVRPDDYYGIGSITKPFIAVIIHQLADEGALRLDMTPQEILGADMVGDIANADTATLAQLMMHTSGVPSWEDDPVWRREGRGADMTLGRLFTKTETLDYIRGKDAHPAVNPAGAAYSYSNSNHTLLGLIIEKVTGKDVLEVLEERIYAPLNLRHVKLEGFETLDPDRLPRRYHLDTEQYRKELGFHPDFKRVEGARLPLVDATGSNMSHEWTAGGMLATAEDLATFGVALMTGALLSDAAQARLLAFQHAERSEEFNETSETSQGLFRTEKPDGSAWIGHRGGAFGYNAHMTWIEGEDVLIVLLTNMGTIHSGGRHITRYMPEMGVVDAARALVAGHGRG